MIKKNCGRKSANYGAALVITMFLLLIISTLTLSFFYLQLLEVDLIAYETDYLQAFYLASAALEQGILRLYDDPNYKSPDKIPLQREIRAVFNPVEQINFDPNDCYFKYMLDQGTWPITIRATAKVNDVQRNVQIQYTRQSRTGDDFSNEIYLGIDTLKNILGDPPLAIINKPITNTVPFGLATVEANSENVKLLTGALDVQSKGVVKYLTQEQRSAFDNFGSKDWIKQVMLATGNSNSLLFYMDDYISRYLSKNYDKLKVGHTIDSYKMPIWEYPFHYVEDREIKYSDGKRATIIKPKMVVQKEMTLSLEPGVYYFAELTVDEKATINTKGEVIIFVEKCILEKDAKMIGGNSDDNNKGIPENLIIILEAPLESDHYPPDMTIKASAQVYGHILSPKGKVIISSGVSRETLVYGSVLTKNFETVLYSLVGSYTKSSYKIGFEGWPDYGLQMVPGSWKEV